MIAAIGKQRTFGDLCGCEHGPTSGCERRGALKRRVFQRADGFDSRRTILPDASDDRVLSDGHICGRVVRVQLREGVEVESGGRMRFAACDGDDEPGQAEMSGDVAGDDVGGAAIAGHDDGPAVRWAGLNGFDCLDKQGIECTGEGFAGGELDTARFDGRAGSASRETREMVVPTLAVRIDGFGGQTGMDDAEAGAACFGVQDELDAAGTGWTESAARDSHPQLQTTRETGTTSRNWPRMMSKPL